MFSLTNPQYANIPFEHHSTDLVDTGHIAMSTEETNGNGVEPIGKK
jgi:hypothetical protein